MLRRGNGVWPKWCPVDVKQGKIEHADSFVSVWSLLTLGLTFVPETRSEVKGILLFEVKGRIHSTLSLEGNSLKILVVNLVWRNQNPADSLHKPSVFHLFNEMSSTKILSIRQPLNFQCFQVVQVTSYFDLHICRSGEWYLVNLGSRKLIIWSQKLNSLCKESQSLI